MKNADATIAVVGRRSDRTATIIQPCTPDTAAAWEATLARVCDGDIAWTREPYRPDLRRVVEDDDG